MKTIRPPSLKSLMSQNRRKLAERIIRQHQMLLAMKQLTIRTLAASQIVATAFEVQRMTDNECDAFLAAARSAKTTGITNPLARGEK